MRHRDLRRLFLGLAAVAAPVPFATVGCGGVVNDAGQRNPSMGVDGTGGSAGSPMFLGGQSSGGGYPNYNGTGGIPNYNGGGAPNYTGMGGYPVDENPFPYGTTGGTTSYYLDAGTAVAPDAGAFCADTRTPAPGLGCKAYCESSNYGAMDAGPTPDCWDLCAGGARQCDFFVFQGYNYVKCYPDCTGRKPPGLVDGPTGSDNDVRTYFEEMSRLEAASIPAFRILGHELRIHGAPRSLLRAARRAARDEVRHARMGKTLATRFGGNYVRPHIVRRPLRSIEAIALDNAVEGCVRETFGAMIATWQARAATDPVVRRIMRRVAVDETRHAALALQVAKWAERHLDADANRRVREARRRAAEVVHAELAYEPTPALASLAGVPSSADARRLATALAEALWA